ERRQSKSSAKMAPLTMTRIKLNIRSKILVSFLSIIVVSAGLILMIMQLNEQYLRQQQVRALQIQTDSTAQRLNDQLQNAYTAYGQLANELNDQAVVDYNTILKQALATSPQTNRLIILDNQGRQLAHYQRNQGPVAPLSV